MSMVKNELIVYKRSSPDMIQCLHGVVVEETKTAYRVQMSKNQSIKVWFNKKAISKPEKVSGIDGYYECVLFDWFTGSEFFSRIWDTYSDTSRG